jgi:hypothetical protein
MTSRTGGCLCGAIRYELLSDPSVAAICHCTHCQRQSGALFSTNLVVPESDYRQSGDTAIYTDRGDSGQSVWRHFCGTCGSPITSRVAVMPGLVIVKAGTLDDFKDVAPAVEVYTDHAARFLPPLAAQRFQQGTG